MSPLDRSQTPRRRGAEAVSFPAFERRGLDNGMTLYSVPRTATPLAAIQVILPASAQSDPPHRPGLAAFTADLMEEGTQSRSSSQIADEIDAMGARISSGAGWNSASVTLSMLDIHFDAGIELLLDVATRPAFATEEIERLRRERLAAILRHRDQASSLAQAALAHAIYGDSTYGRLLIGGEASLSAIGRSQIVDFFARHRSPRATSVIAIGDLPGDELVARLTEAFAAAEEEPEKTSAIVAPAPQPQVVIVDRPQAAQTELRLGHVGQPRLHPDRIALTVMNSLLGGKFMSRINLNLRERHGYTYGASSSFALRHGPGPFIVSTAVANGVAGAAAREVLFELRRLRDEPVAEVELADTISYLQGVFPYGLQTTGGLLQRMRSLAIFGLPDDYFETYLEQIGGVSIDDVQRVSRQHLFPDELAIVAVGPAKDLAPQLDSLAEPSVLTPASLLT